MSGRKSIKIEAPVIITSDGTPVWMDKNWVVDFFDWLKICQQKKVRESFLNYVMD
jgi:hypothetical protein